AESFVSRGVSIAWTEQSVPDSVLMHVDVKMFSVAPGPPSFVVAAERNEVEPVRTGASVFRAAVHWVTHRFICPAATSFADPLGHFTVLQFGIHRIRSPWYVEGLRERQNARIIIALPRSGAGRNRNSHQFGRRRKQCPRSHRIMKKLGIDAHHS